MIIGDSSEYMDELVELLSAQDEVAVVDRLTPDDAARAWARNDCSADVVVVDAGALHAFDGAEADLFDSIRTRFPDAHIFIIAGVDQLDAPARTTRAPVVAVAAKQISAADLAATIRTASTGAIATRTEDVMPLMRRMRSRYVADPPLWLTPREKEVLQMLGRGSHVTAIARTLGISVQTVRGYVKAILAKFKCHSQLEAVVKAYREGWISYDG